MKNNKSVSTRIILIIIVIVFVNVLSDRFFVRLDLTADQSYTLSKATKNILRNLDEPVTVTAYFTEDVPSNLIKTKRDFMDLLVEYNSISKGKLMYEFVDPGTDPQTEKKANDDGVQAILVSVREKDQVKQQKAYLGAVIQKGNKVDAIPVIQPGAAMEYDLSSTIKKMSVMVKPKVGFVTGNGEASLDSYQQAMQALRILYQVEEVNLADTVKNLNDFATLAIIAPKDSIPEYQLWELDEFMANGGRIFMAYNRVAGDMNTASGSSVNTNFDGWLASKGVNIDNAFVVDNSSITVQARQQNGFVSIMRFPYIPLVSSFEDHPITKGLEEIMMPFVSQITFNGDTSKIKYYPIVKSSKNSGTLAPPLVFAVNKRWTKNDYPLSGLTLGAVLEGDLSGQGMDTKMVLIADGDFPVNGTGQQAQKLKPDNVNLLVNSIDWLSDDTGLIELRTKGVTSRPLDQVEDGQKAIIKWLNFLLPILLIILYGVFRMQRNRTIRMKRMEEDYV
jgi:gliding motility-associatede transport system auxiliary component